MRALVTGATGCVGANVVEVLLSCGYDVWAMHRSTSRLDALEGLTPEFIEGDVLDTASLEHAMAGCDIVFHVAAVSEYWRAPPKQIYRINVAGTRNILQTAIKCHIDRVVYTSSVAVFGLPTFRGEILNESSEFSYSFIPFHYGHSKWLAEAEVDRCVAQGLDVVTVNPASVIGQRDINYIGGELIKTAKKGWFIAAPSGGMGVVSAKDVGLGHLLAAEIGQTGARYILNGENLPHYDLLKIVASEIAVSPPRFVLPAIIGRALARLMHILNQGGIRLKAVDPIQMYLSTIDMYFDSIKAISELGFEPRSAVDAVKEAVNWYKQYGML